MMRNLLTVVSHIFDARFLKCEGSKTDTGCGQAARATVFLLAFILFCHLTHRMRIASSASKSLSKPLLPLILVKIAYRVFCSTSRDFRIGQLIRLPFVPFFPEDCRSVGGTTEDTLACIDAAHLFNGLTPLIISAFINESAGELNGTCWTRTNGPRINSPLLYRLS